MLLARVDVALRINGDAPDREKLSRIPPAGSEAAERYECIALKDVHLLVVTVGDEHVSLLCVRAREARSHAGP
jgi:hypothetical protein